MIGVVLRLVDALDDAAPLDVLVRSVDCYYMGN